MCEHRLPGIDEFDAAARVVYRTMPATPQYRWPLLEERAGCAVWVKHENHTPIGSFKLRGALVAVERLRRARPGVTGVIAATRGNYGQSVAYAARAAGLSATVVVPFGNAREKNAAMRAFGARLVEHGRDFDEALPHAQRLAERDGLHMMPSFHPDLVPGTATYGAELFRAVPGLDAVYVPIGLGSGICGVLAARDALSPATAVIGVVSAALPAYERSFAAGEARETGPGDTVADGMAVRKTHPVSLELVLAGVERVVAVTEAELRAAMCAYYTDTHNVAEGAGAAPLAALLREREAMRGRRVALVLSGGNVDRELFAQVLAST
ncbi:MAG: threonine dehydratase [Spirochaetaceae bacterium]|nr:threonine dehydratase [Spirochaetaceae bacterium]